MKKLRNYRKAITQHAWFGSIGDKENNRIYLEKFYLLLEEDVSFTLFETKKKADRRGEEKFYLSDYGELDTHSTELPFVLEDYLYYFFDMSGDGIPELCITPKDYGNQFVYIFQYKKETDEIILWHELNNGVAPLSAWLTINLVACHRINRYTVTKE